jgi:DNA-binding MarR family transcriptional regulator
MSTGDTNKISVREFIRQLGFVSGRDNILAACYYAEFVEEKSDFSIAEIQTLLDVAKVPQISNLSRDLRALAEKRYLNRVKSSADGIRYTVTNKGADVISDKMAAVGLILHKPSERAELLKEIAESLHPFIQQIPDQNEREYIEEAVSCLSPVINALRAAVVLGWSATVFNLRRKIDQRGAAGYAQFTSHLQKINPKAKVVALNDLEDIKDAHLIDICEKMNIIAGKSAKGQLDQWLTFRNGVAHPTNVKPGIHKVKAFFEDIMQYVLIVP